MENTILKRLEALRNEMKLHDVQAVIIPTSDFHDTEYVSDHFKAREYYSGFTGSAGVLVVTLNGGALWTDGRYYLQAQKQLEGSGLILMKEGMPDTPSIEEWLVENLKPHNTVAVDGRVITYDQFEKYLKALQAHEIRLIVDQDLPGLAWIDRPALPKSKTWSMPIEFAGESTENKLEALRKKIKDQNASAHMSQKIDEIAWLYNLRADDIPSFPVPLAYTIIREKNGALYIDSSRLDEASRKALENAGIEIREYDQIYEDAARIEEPVLMEKTLINSRLASSVQNPVWGKNPITPMKAVKNEAEKEGARKAHIKDGAAMVRYWKWLEEMLDQGTAVSEVDGVHKVHELRAEQPGFIEDSFDAISAYGPNAAMPHYHAADDACSMIEPKGLYLLDSGGHYLEGTTDITRTFVVGDLSDEEREGFTRVLMGHIDLARARYPKGTRGYNLDVLARGPLWAKGMDYNHGTGHGVGHVLSVHEGPNSFNWKVTPTRNGSTILEPGMITSNEPGLYIEDKYGIRHENLLLCAEDIKTPYGTFYKNEVLTMVPFDVRGLNLKLMNQDQIDWLNDYHQEVFKKVSPLLDEDETAWLEKKCRPISK